VADSRTEGTKKTDMVGSPGRSLRSNPAGGEGVRKKSLGVKRVTTRCSWCMTNGHKELRRS